MKFRLLKIVIATTVILTLLTGCNKEVNKNTEYVSKVENDVNEIDLEATDKYDGKEANAMRTHFKEEVKTLTYFKDGKEYNIDVDSEEGKTIISMMKERIATCEIIDKDIVVNKSKDIKNGKALEIKFTKKTKSTFYIFKEDKYSDVEFDGLLMPLEGEYSQRLLLAPEENGTFTISGKPDKLVNYLKNNVE